MRSGFLPELSDGAMDALVDRAWARSAHERVERFGTGAAYLDFLPAEGQEPVRGRRPVTSG